MKVDDVLPARDLARGRAAHPLPRPGRVLPRAAAAAPQALRRRLRVQADAGRGHARLARLVKALSGSTLKRDLGALAAREHDVLVVGGGIHGAAVAWDAALRGLRGGPRGGGGLRRRARPGTASRRSTAACATCSARTWPGCASRRASARRSCASRPRWCGRSPSWSRPTATASAGARRWASRCSPATLLTRDRNRGLDARTHPARAGCSRAAEVRAARARARRGRPHRRRAVDRRAGGEQRAAGARVPALRGRGGRGGGEPRGGRRADARRRRARHRGACRDGLGGATRWTCARG